MKIVNLTQHAASSDQMEEGVFEPMTKERVKALLTFDEMPTREEMIERAAELADLAVKEGVKAAMIGGAPYFMVPLEAALLKRGVKPLYAFSRRETVEEKLLDGSVRKTAVFRHLGFVESVTQLPTAYQARGVCGIIHGGGGWESAPPRATRVEAEQDLPGLRSSMYSDQETWIDELWHPVKTYSFDELSPGSKAPVV